MTLGPWDGNVSTRTVIEDIVEHAIELEERVRILEEATDNIVTFGLPDEALKACTVDGSPAPAYMAGQPTIFDAA